MVDGLSFHHLGYASLSSGRDEALLAALGYHREQDEFVDEQQGIRGQFLVGGGPRVELLCAIEGSDVLKPWLERGIKMYHLAYEVAEVEGASVALEGLGAQVVSEPKPAVAFHGRRVTFLMLPNILLVELIESGVEI